MPGISNKNVDITKLEFPRRLRQLRLERNLTATDLAQHAGLSYRTILEIEKGARKRVQAKTLMLLADALEMTFDELLQDGRSGSRVPEAPPSADGRGPRWLQWSGVAALVLIALFGSLYHRALATAEWEIAGSDLRIQDGVLGHVLWESQGEATISICERSPWSNDVLLVGRRGEMPDGGNLTALSLAKGDTLWTVRPDIGQIVDAFGTGLVDTPQFNCRLIERVDIDGDGNPELAVYFDHIRWSPSTILQVDDEGRILGQYGHRGHLYALCGTDLDGDGREELLAGGINNSSGWGTIVVLDQEHWNGASVELGETPPAGISDGSAMRFVTPHFPEPFRDCWTGRYLGVETLMVNRGPDGRPIIDAAIAIDGCTVLLSLDQDLRPVKASINDAFRQRIAQWPPELRDRPNPADQQWLWRWLDGAVHVPPSGLVSLPDRRIRTDS